MQRRSSSIGYSMMDGDFKHRSSSLGLGQMQNVGIDDVVMPPHRPLVGGASAAAYEAARADHYSSLAAKKRLSGDGPHRSSLGAGGMMSPNALGGGGPGLATSSNQHYEMLKLHHMNLLNEIQETTLMMNLYQQQQLQQQREALQEQERLDAQGSKGTPQMKLSQQQDRGMEYGSVYGGMPGGYVGGARGMMEGMGRSPSLGMGGVDGMGRSPSLGMGGGMNGRSPSLGLGGSGPGGPPGIDQRQASTKEQAVPDGRPRPEMSVQQELLAQEQEQKILEERLRKVRAEIAQRQREAEALEASFGAQDEATEKRKPDAGSDDPTEDDPSSRKKRKSDDSSGVTSCEI